MTAIVYKDWIVVSPLELIKPYSMQCDSRICGKNRDFFALTSETAVSAPLLNHLTVEFLHSARGYGRVDRESKTYKLHLLHSSGVIYIVIAEDYLFTVKPEVVAIDATKFKKGEVADYQGIESTSNFLKGVIHNTDDPHKVVSLMSVLWQDIMPSYYAIPLPVFLEWMKAGAEDWPFKQYPEGCYTECLPEKSDKSIARKSPARKTQAKP